MNLSKHKGPGDVVSEIIMSRTGFTGCSFLIVEGDEDSRFFKGRVAKNTCEIVIAGAKTAVEGSIQKLDALHFRGALGICDDDCVSLNGVPQISPNLLCTEARDLDTWLIRSPALERLLAVYGDGPTIDAFESNNGPIRDNLIRIALPFGRLRWLSIRNGLGISFDSLKPLRFVKSKWSFNPDDLFDAAAQQINTTSSTLRALTDALPAADPWLVCQGHDLMHILALGLRDGPLARRNLGSDHIGSVLRAALDDSHWLASRLAMDIRQWESRNVPFRVL
jgi:Protein of unknown function (DUF4435)